MSLHIQHRPFPGIEPAPAPDLSKTAAGALAGARQALAAGQRPPAPPCEPGCTCSAWCRDEWEYFAAAIGACEACGEPCRSTDPAGRKRHPSCGVPA
jgi:hypothetical protein